MPITIRVNLTQNIIGYGIATLCANNCSYSAFSTIILNLSTSLKLKKKRNGERDEVELAAWEWAVGIFVG